MGPSRLASLYCRNRRRYEPPLNTDVHLFSFFSGNEPRSFLHGFVQGGIRPSHTKRKHVRMGTQ